MASFVFVHGSGQNASCWSRVASALTARGHAVATPELPKRAADGGLEGHAARIAAAIDGPRAVVVAHSFSGVFLPLVAQARDCGLLVFLAAVVPEPGKSVREQFAEDPSMFGAEWIAAGARWFDPTQVASLAREFLFHDCDEATLAWALPTVELFETRHLVTEPSPFTRWPEVPVASIVATGDRTLSPDWSRRATRRVLGTEPIEMASRPLPARLAAGRARGTPRAARGQPIALTDPRGSCAERRRATIRDRLEPVWAMAASLRRAVAERHDIPKASEQLLAETEWLGRLARQLVPVADQDDLVQDVLLQAMRREDRPVHVRGWLATVARNLATRRQQRERNRRSRERSVARPESGEPSAAETVEAFATHRAVVNAVMELDEPYRNAVLLRFWNGLPPREIARVTGAPVETVRTRIKRGVDRLRARLDTDAGNRMAWVAPLLHVGSVRRSLVNGALANGAPVAPVSLLAGVLTMKTAWIAAAVVASTLGLIATLAFHGDRRGADAAVDTATRSVRADGATDRVAAAPAEPDGARVPAPADARTGALLVRVRHHDGSAALDVGVYVRPRRPDALGIEARTGADGTFAFHDLPAGACLVLLDRGAERIVTVSPDAETECELRIARGVLVHGRVITLDAQPVADARVYAFDRRHEDLAVFLGRTDSTGRFVLRDVMPGLELCARADGWQPAGRRDLARVRGEPGDTVEVAIRLGARGEALYGTVLDASGRPAPHAWVGIAVDEDCRKRIDGLEKVRTDEDGMLDRDTFFVRADSDGRFATTEVPWGDVAVLARGAGAQASQVGDTRVRVDKQVANQVVVQLHPGAAVFGTVRDETGAPYGGVRLRAEFHGNAGIGELAREFGHELADRYCVTAADGSYRLEGLFAAAHRLRRTLDTDEYELERFELSAGEQKRLDVTVPRTWQLRVVVQDEHGSPLEGWGVILSDRARCPFATSNGCAPGPTGCGWRRGCATSATCSASTRPIRAASDACVDCRRS